jgi:hypothetical protein
MLNNQTGISFFGSNILKTFRILHFNFQFLFKSRKILSVLFLCFFSIVSHGQDTSFEYFSESKYKDYPIISLRENFFGNPVYFIEGSKAGSKEVRAYMEVMPGDANLFAQTHTKTISGTFLGIGGQALVLGALGYFYNNRSGLNSDIVRNWFFMTIGGGITSGIGRQMNRQGVRKINGLIENHNYLVNQDQLGSVYLKMDFRQNFFGEKIDIYDGPNLLDKARIRTLMEEKPEVYADYRKALNQQKISFGLDMTSLAVDIVVIAYIISPQFQSSTPSNLLIPLIFTNIGLSIASSQYRRSARNLTRHALDRYNFGDRLVPIVKQPSLEFNGPSVTLFSMGF